MKPITRRELLAIVAGLIAYVRIQPGHAESSSGGPKRFAIVRSAASDGSTSEGAHWQQIADGIVSDLAASGRFALIETDLSRQIADVDVPPELQKWRSTRAEWLIVGRVTKPDHRLLVMFRLWNLTNGQQLLGQQYMVSKDDLQQIPHILAQALIEHLSGEHDDRSDANEQK